MTDFNNKPFSVRLGGETGINPYRQVIERRLSDLSNYFQNRKLVDEMLKRGENPKIYEVYEIPQPSRSGLINVSCTILYPGKIGDEYYFTKGHFHVKEASEVYIGLKGEGMVLMQSADGTFKSENLKPGVLIYIPPSMAHRTVNVGGEKLVFLALFPSDAGHDYGSIEESGFAKIVVEENGKPSLKDNPNFPKNI